MAKATETKNKFEMVSINIPLTTDRNDDVYVSVAGVGEYQIKRGVDVLVPAPVADVIKQSQKLEQDILKKRIKMQNELYEHTAELG